MPALLCTESLEVVEVVEEIKSAKNILEPFAWLLQLITGIILIFLVTAHFYLTHMTSHDALSYDSVASRLSSPVYTIMYSILILTVSFHAFNGLRAIILDTEFGARNRRAINLAAFLGFFTAFAYGIYLLAVVP